MFGALLLWEAVRYFEHGWMHDDYIAPGFHFKYLYFEWAHAWPG